MKNAVLLSVMMFLQFMMLPVWFVPMFPYVQALPGSEHWVVWCGLIMGFGTFTSPLFGMFADRFFNAERVLAACNFVGAGLLALAAFVRTPGTMFAVLLGAMCFYMPTWSLTATIALAHSTKRTFPRIRVFGTVGWVASGVFSLVGARCFGLVDFDATPWIFLSGAFVSLVAALFAFALPQTEPVAKGTPMSVSDALGLKALVLFRNPSFCAFAALLLLAMLPFQWYNVYCSAYLKETGFKYLTMTMNLGQAGEIGFMLLVPVIISRFGYKKAMLVALAALAFRNACFLGASSLGLVALDFGGILIHGLIFGILIVGSQMFIDEVAPQELRNQAQGLVNLLTAGLGVFASNFLFDRILAHGATPAAPHAWSLAYAVAVGLSVFAMLFAAVFLRERREKGMRTKGLLVIVLALAGLTASAKANLDEPKDGAVVPLLTDAQKAYLALPRAERREKFADSGFRRKEMGLPAETVGGEKSARMAYWPKTVRLAWTAKDGVACRVSVKDAKTGAEVYAGSSEVGSANVDNLEIAAEYEWSVDDGDGVATAKFRTEDMAPRLVRFPGVPNVRDLGGRIGLGGKRVRQGLVFRSAGLNNNASSTYYTKEELVRLGRQDESKNGKRVVKSQTPGKSRVEGENGAYILKRFGIRSDIDLRSDGECYGMTGSPLGETVTWFHYSSAAYGGMQGEFGKAAFKKVFKVFLNRKNYPIDFHCIAGQDRTGAVAFILNALLGVEEDQLYLDWETTGFWNRSAGFNHEKLFDKLVDGFKKNYPAQTINESVEKYVLSLGFTAEDIATFRGIML